MVKGQHLNISQHALEILYLEKFLRCAVEYFWIPWIPWIEYGTARARLLRGQMRHTGHTGHTGQLKKDPELLRKQGM
jgi:hypothetical protein